MTKRQRSAKWTITAELSPSSSRFIRRGISARGFGMRLQGRAHEPGSHPIRRCWCDATGSCYGAAGEPRNLPGAYWQPGQQRLARRHIRQCGWAGEHSLHCAARQCWQHHSQRQSHASAIPCVRLEALPPGQLLPRCRGWRGGWLARCHRRDELHADGSGKRFPTPNDTFRASIGDPLMDTEEKQDLHILRLAEEVRDQGFLRSLLDGLREARPNEMGEISMTVQLRDVIVQRLERYISRSAL